MFNLILKFHLVLNAKEKEKKQKTTTTKQTNKRGFSRISTLYLTQAPTPGCTRGCKAGVIKYNSQVTNRSYNSSDHRRPCEIHNNCNSLSSCGISTWYQLSVNISVFASKTHSLSGFTMSKTCFILTKPPIPVQHNPVTVA